MGGLSRNRLQALSPHRSPSSSLAVPAPERTGSEASTPVVEMVETKLEKKTRGSKAKFKQPTKKKDRKTERTPVNGKKTRGIVTGVSFGLWRNSESAQNETAELSQIVVDPSEPDLQGNGFAEEPVAPEHEASDAHVEEAQQEETEEVGCADAKRNDVAYQVDVLIQTGDGKAAMRAIDRLTEGNIINALTFFGLEYRTIVTSLPQPQSEFGLHGNTPLWYLHPLCSSASASVLQSACKRALVWKDCKTLRRNAEPGLQSAAADSDIDPVSSSNIVSAHDPSIPHSSSSTVRCLTAAMQCSSNHIRAVFHIC